MFPALPFVLQLVSPIITSVVLDRLQKYGTDTDWTKVMIDADRKARDVVPGVMFDDAVVTFLNRQIRNVAQALADTGEMAKVLKLLAAGQFSEAGYEVIRHAFPSADVPAAA